MSAEESGRLLGLDVPAIAFCFVARIVDEADKRLV
jgi:hypothetical protein